MELALELQLVLELVLELELELERPGERQVNLTPVLSREDLALFHPHLGTWAGSL